MTKTNLFEFNLKEEKNFYQNLVANIIDDAKKLGADQVEVSGNIDQGLSLEVRCSNVEKLEFNKGQALEITVLVNNSSATVATSDFEKNSLKSTISKAIDLAKLIAPDKYSGIPEKELLAYNYSDLDLYHPLPIDIETMIDVLQKGESLAFEHDKRISNSDGATFDTNIGLEIYGNSNDFIGIYPTSDHSIGFSLIAKTKKEMQRDYWYTHSRVPNKLENADAVALKASERTLARLNSKTIKTKNMPVIFNFETAKSLIGHFLKSISGHALYNEATFLQNAIDTQIFPDFMNLREKPLLHQGTNSAPFDGEGVRTVENLIVDSGVVKNYILDCYSARRLGMKTTGNSGGVFNLHLDMPKNALSFDSLVRELYNGVIITDLMGHSVNLVTGDYSRGASGFLVENGVITDALREFTVAGNLKDMFSQIKLLGTDIDTRGNIQVGSILIENMMIAGN